MYSSDLDRNQQLVLLVLARQSIAHGLSYGVKPEVNAADYEPALQAIRASFVTLTIQGKLRGCIGALEARQPLVEDVSGHAWAAAFSDHRFRPLDRSELESIRISISVLSVAEPVSFANQSDLLSQLRPGEDGLIMQAAGRRGTFLPSVWRSLPEPGEFLAQLKLKAGLPVDYWSDDLLVSRYTTLEFAED